MILGRPRTSHSTTRADDEWRETVDSARRLRPEHGIRRSCPPTRSPSVTVVLAVGHSRHSPDYLISDATCPQWPGPLGTVDTKKSAEIWQRFNMWFQMKPPPSSWTRGIANQRVNHRRGLDDDHDAARVLRISATVSATLVWSRSGPTRHGDKRSESVPVPRRAPSARAAWLPARRGLG